MPNFIRSFFFLIFASISFNSLAALPITVGGQKLPSLAPLIKKVSPAVVNITVSGLHQGPQQFSGLGSGVIIDAKNGYIVTNYHVIERAKKITINLISGHQYDARVVGQDPQSDIALLQIKSTEDLVEIVLSDSDKLQVGDFTIAIGNPFGLGQTVTSGIVSALGRSGLNQQNLENYIQTDAAINSGNSGGALLNLRGELIGINTAILGPNGGNIGIAFAIPTNMVKNLTQQILEFGEVHRGVLGIKGGEVTPELAKSFALNVTYGAFIYQVTPNSAADNAGLKAGDVITEINGTPIKSFAALRAKIGSLSAGKKVSLKAIQNNQSKTIDVILGGKIKTALINTPLPIPFEGATLTDSGLNQKFIGVNVVKVQQRSMAERVGLMQGDVIIAINRTRISNKEQLIKAFSSIKTTRALNIIRNNRPIYLMLD